MQRRDPSKKVGQKFFTESVSSCERYKTSKPNDLISNKTSTTKIVYSKRPSGYPPSVREYLSKLIFFIIISSTTIKTSANKSFFAKKISEQKKCTIELEI